MVSCSTPSRPSARAPPRHYGRRPGRSADVGEQQQSGAALVPGPFPLQPRPPRNRQPYPAQAPDQPAAVPAEGGGEVSLEASVRLAFPLSC